jgi:hypothetical protein
MGEVKSEGQRRKIRVRVQFRLSARLRFLKLLHVFS